MDYFRAREIADKIIKKRYKEHQRIILIDEEFSFEFERGWVFCYNTRAYIEDRNSENYLLVSIPILVDKIDGMVYKLMNPKRRFVAPEELIDDYLVRKQQENQRNKIELEEIDYDYDLIPYTYQIK